CAAFTDPSLSARDPSLRPEGESSIPRHLPGLRSRMTSSGLTHFFNGLLAPAPGKAPRWGNDRGAPRIAILMGRWVAARRALRIPSPGAAVRQDHPFATRRRPWPPRRVGPVALAASVLLHLLVLLTLGRSCGSAGMPAA